MTSIPRENDPSPFPYQSDNLTNLKRLWSDVQPYDLRICQQFSFSSSHCWVCIEELLRRQERVRTHPYSLLNKIPVWSHCFTSNCRRETIKHHIFPRLGRLWRLISSVQSQLSSYSASSRFPLFKRSHSLLALHDAQYNDWGFQMSDLSDVSPCYSISNSTLMKTSQSSLNGFPSQISSFQFLFFCFRC